MPYNRLRGFEKDKIGPKDGEDYVEEIQAITPQQVQAVARKYLVPSHLTITHLIPSQADNQGA